ncbi:kinase-like domain-containing protein [Multifurca ochricompacta]|uniref:Kinase-like domain-containing protein n=1 Tax=Multifurca ochricompacta TaxID=376703 RepID=A0AAD4M902_9AGAM|nr:kinase-like domain-containing protein [Multifurca ochricompacta]
MSELFCRLSVIMSPLQMLQQAYSHRTIPYLRHLVNLPCCSRFLPRHRPTPPLHSSLDETAPLLEPPHDAHAPTYTSPEVKPDSFRPLRLISQGVSGKVYLVQDSFTGETFALKVIRKRQHNLAQVVNEKDVLRNVAGISWFLSLEASIHDDTNFYLVTAPYPTDLQNDLHLRGGRIPLVLARFYTAELICALEVLHARGIIHRDIKLANILLTVDGHVVLADFGMAKIFLEHSSAFPDRSHHRAATTSTGIGLAGVNLHQPYVHGSIDLTREKVGTLAYAAPEVRLGLPYSYGVDFWSLGVLLYVMLTGRFPFGPLGEHFTLHFEHSEVDESARALLEQVRCQLPSSLAYLRLAPFKREDSSHQPCQAPQYS